MTINLIFNSIPIQKSNNNLMLCISILKLSRQRSGLPGWTARFIIIIKKLPDFYNF